jgi:hypothetical protein
MDWGKLQCWMLVNTNAIAVLRMFVTEEPTYVAAFNDYETVGREFAHRVCDSIKQLTTAGQTHDFRVQNLHYIIDVQW